MARKCYLTHAYRDDREVEYVPKGIHSNPPSGYVCIRDQFGLRYVPVDSVYFKEEEDWDDLI